MLPVTLSHCPTEIVLRNADPVPPTETSSANDPGTALVADQDGKPEFPTEHDDGEISEVESDVVEAIE